MRAASRFLVSGIVQGVGYRYWTCRAAAGLGLDGWVRNLADGRVEIWAEGPPDLLRALGRSCWEGPRSSEVSDVEQTAGEPEGLSGFTVRY